MIDDPDKDGVDVSKADTYVLVGWDKPESGTDTDLKTSFPKNEDFKLQAGEYLLIVNRDPRETQLANGVNVDEAIAGREIKAGATAPIHRPLEMLQSAG